MGIGARAEAMAASIAREPPDFRLTWRWPARRWLLLWPSLALWSLVAMPIGLIVIVSFAHTVPGASYEPAFELDNYRRFMEPHYYGILVFSLWVSALVAIVGVALGFPFTYCLTRLRPRTQIVWLVCLLAALSLSEVLIAFAWQVLLSRNGLSRLLVEFGLLERRASLQPSFGAMLTALVYFVLPYIFLLFYPALSRLDPSLVEAASTMGAGPVRSFFTVVVPALRVPIVGALLLVFVYTLGAYITPSQLGKPPHWTLPVHITDQAIAVFNLPFAAAMAVILMVVSLALVALTTRLGAGSGEGRA